MNGARLAAVAACRFGTSMPVMVYAGSLPQLIPAWGMSATEAGAVQGAYHIAYATGLVAASWLAGHVGARRVFLGASWATLVAYLLFATFARSSASALVFLPILALAQAGTYTPSIMLVADSVEPARRGRAIGWTLAAASFSYVVSIAIAAGWAATVSYEAVFWIVAAGPVLGAVAASLATRRLPDRVHRQDAGGSTWASMIEILRARRARLLILGYAAHTWELFGAWTWMPAFLTTTLLAEAWIGPAAIGLAVGAALHVAGAAASLTMGAVSDRVGRIAVLRAMAAGGMALSLAIGWCAGLPGPLLLMLAFVYGFAIHGDSGVLSTAMTEAVAPRDLGTLLALRSIIGWGVGALAPVAFGRVLDLTNEAGALPSVWGWGFLILAVGGGVATLAALSLREPKSA